MFPRTNMVVALNYARKVQEINNMDLSDDEKKALKRMRLNDMVNNRGGYKKNPDKNDHPFSKYFICRRQIIINTVPQECEWMSLSEEEAIEHAKSHLTEALKKGAH